MYHHYNISFCLSLSLSLSGAPTYNTTYQGIPHLRVLLHNAIDQVKKEGILELSVEETLALPLSIVGFSKGCIVLNQILYELQNYVPAEKDSELQESKNSLEGNFVKQFKAMYWLDSGHSGDEGAWVTDRDVLKHLVHFPIAICVHVTPHQMDHPERPWNKMEEKAFVATLQKLGVNVSEKMHFGDEPRSFKNHFKLLNEF